jgi:erythromycin esterase-like protein
MGLRAWEEQLWLPDPQWYEVRDRAMANMMLRVRALEAPGKKMAVWAWNWHVAWRYETVSGWDADTAHKLTRQGGRSMGGFLRDSLGSGYRPIALVGYQVHTFSAQDPIPTHGLSIERWLNQFDADYLLVDLRAPVAGGIIAPGTKYSLSREWADPYQQYSALLFLAHSPGMTFVP